jgi:hypothetical protein
MNEMRVPSGDQAGLLALMFRVSTTMFEPSAFTAHTVEPPSARHVKAMRSPSGDHEAWVLMNLLGAVTSLVTLKRPASIT